MENGRGEGEFVPKIKIEGWDGMGLVPLSLFSLIFFQVCEGRPTIERDGGIRVTEKVEHGVKAVFFTNKTPYAIEALVNFESGEDVRKSIRPRRSRGEYNLFYNQNVVSF